jgi:hypothetical protein
VFVRSVVDNDTGGHSKLVLPPTYDPGPGCRLAL